MTDLSDLITRVEAGKGADRELDAEVGLAFRVPNWRELKPWERTNGWAKPGVASDAWSVLFQDGLGSSERIPSYTTSFDAVLSLMPPECFWQLGHDGDGPDPSKFKARVFNPMKMRGPCISVTVDPVRALLAAILRAKEAG